MSKSRKYWTVFTDVFRTMNSDHQLFTKLIDKIFTNQEMKIAMYKSLDASDEGRLRYDVLARYLRLVPDEAIEAAADIAPGFQSLTAATDEEPSEDYEIAETPVALGDLDDEAAWAAARGDDIEAETGAVDTTAPVIQIARSTPPSEAVTEIPKVGTVTIDSKTKATAVGLDEIDFMTVDIRIRPVVVPANYFKGCEPKVDTIMYRVWARNSADKGDKIPVEYSVTYYDGLIEALGGGLESLGEELLEKLIKRSQSYITTDNSVTPTAEPADKSGVDESDTLYQQWD